jgi:hypothetical protein
MIKRSAVDKSYEKSLLRNPYRQFWAASSTLVTPGSLMAFNPVSIIFIWGELGKRLMGADVIIGLIPSLELLVMLVQPDRDILDFIELLSMRPVRSFDIALKLR